MTNKEDKNFVIWIGIGIGLFLILIFPDFREYLLISVGIILTVLILAKAIQFNKKKKVIHLNSKSLIATEINFNMEEDIIDVNAGELDLGIDYQSNYNDAQLQPPHWNHFYVYSHDEINYATPDQKRYYAYFKKKVLNGEFVDVQGYTNYAFILYFDLLNEYQYHQDFKLLENQFNLIGQICPKTKKYTLQILVDELKKRNDSSSIEKLGIFEDPLFQLENGYSVYNPYANKLGSLYKDKLKLPQKEIDLLNKIWFSSNVFLSNEDCLIEVMRIYCIVLNDLEKKWEVADIAASLKEIITNELIRKKDYFGSFESDVYLNIFKRSENAVRTIYGHNRKILDENLLKYSTRVQANFNKLIGAFIDELLIENEKKIKKPTKDAQIELNTQNVNRWKIEFNKLKDSFQESEIGNFTDGIKNLEETNQKNPNIENIFFEASKFIANYDAVQSLKYYAKYIYYDLKSVKFDNKEITKTVQKSLFASPQQINDFRRIIAELIETSNIEKALEEISIIFLLKRKTIVLDQSKIQDAELKHDVTVELLNEYLQTENIDFSQESFDKNRIEIISTDPHSSIFVSDIRMGKVQEELVKIIIANSFKILQDEVDEFAIGNGMFKNQLIDSINEACSEYLDGESLIEEIDNKFVIEESYFKEIAL